MNTFVKKESSDQEFSIGQVAEMFHIPISTLRYYDKEGLFPDMPRNSGIRKFTDQEIESLRIIECLKKSGMDIKSIRQFMEWCSEGSGTYALRLELFLKQKTAVESEIKRLEKALDMIRFKCWYYEQAILAGNEDRLNEMLPDQLPAEIQALYDHAHESLE